MKTVADIIDKVGKSRALAAFGVGPRALNTYIQNNKLPAAWFDGLEKMTRRRLDRSLFTFKGHRDH